MGKLLRFPSPEEQAVTAMDPYLHTRQLAQELAATLPGVVCEYRHDRAILPDGEIAGLDWEQYDMGVAKCFGCKRTWVAIVAQISPDPTHFYECPSCHREKGLLKNAYAPPDGAMVWTCNCGNNLFYMTPEGHWCPNCGVYADDD